MPMTVISTSPILYHIVNWWPEIINEDKKSENKSKLKFRTHTHVNHELSHLWPSNSPADGLSHGFNRNIDRRNSTRFVPSAPSSVITPYRWRASSKLTTPTTLICSRPYLDISHIPDERLIKFTDPCLLGNSLWIASPSCNRRDQSLLRPPPAYVQDDIVLQSMWALLVH